MNKTIYLILFVFCFWSCTQQEPENAVFVDELPSIFPENFETTIPFNIAPLNFKMQDNVKALFVSVKGEKSSFEQAFKKNKTHWNQKQWSRFLEENKGDSIHFTVYAKVNERWNVYKPFCCYVSNDAIDAYLMYRLISPGYQTWNKMGLYQRELGSFKETAMLDNKIMPHSCMNCHTMSANNPDNMVFHIRENNSGTFLIKDGELQKLVSKKETPFKSVSFPNWHPSEKYIAFSINKVRQAFPSEGTERAHAFDMGSDMVIYDVEKEEYIISPTLYKEDSFEAFPCFSPDGKSLYFISAPAAPMPKDIRNIQYSLCRVDFNPANGQVSEKVDTLISPRQTGKSHTMPRISPNGKFIMLTLSDYGNFPAYNEEADLYLYNVADSSLTELETLNSNQVESYHSWSSSGRWVVFSSRRMDGLFMNVYIAHVDENGRFGKPFLLPQEDPDFHQSFLFSFNLPELAIKPIPVSPQQIARIAKQNGAGKKKYDTTH